jgi:hypothetical protein
MQKASSTTSSLFPRPFGWLAERGLVGEVLPLILALLLIGIINPILPIILLVIGILLLVGLLVLG